MRHRSRKIFILISIIFCIVLFVSPFVHTHPHGANNFTECPACVFQFYLSLVLVVPYLVFAFSLIKVHDDFCFYFHNDLHPFPVVFSKLVNRAPPAI